MESFYFYNPTRIYFGRNVEERIGKVLSFDGVKRILFLYGGGAIKKIGLYDRVLNCLKESKVEFVEHPGVKSNPLLSHTIEGVRKAKSFEVDAILGVGGGSVVDEAKAIALGVIVGENNLWSYFKKEKRIEKALPVYAILTLAATGTEMNGNAVITHDETKEKLYVSSSLLNPRASFLNPELTFSVPKEYQSYAAVDVIAHLIELYFSSEYCPKIQARLIEGLIKTVMEVTEIIHENPNDYNSRAEFMWASTLALNGLFQLGFKGGGFPNHLIAHAIGGLYDLPHGACLSVIIPAWMSWYKDKNSGQFRRFAMEIFGQDDPQKGILSLRDWFRKIGAPVSLQEVGLNAKDIDIISKMTLQISNYSWLEKPYTLEEIREILSLAF